jgi:RimJ/RimL family protein N-acetyltransferase
VSSLPHEPVLLRERRDEDADAIFAMERDPASVRQAAFGPEHPDDREAFDARWKRVRAGAGIALIIEIDGSVAGNVLSFVADERRYVGYWIERSYHGRGIASTALAQFIRTIDERPLWAWVAEDNTASRRVLERCGFQEVGREVSWSAVRGTDVPELLYTLTASSVVK